MVMGVELEHSLVVSELMSKAITLRVGNDSNTQPGTSIYIFSYICTYNYIHG